ncbi:MULTISPECIES: hypothetical protein [Cytobacillus]|nr:MULTISPECIES: hypothetical protein [Cytobacillus]
MELADFGYFISFIGQFFILSVTIQVYRSHFPFYRSAFQYIGQFAS